MTAGMERGPIPTDSGQGPLARPESRLIGIETGGGTTAGLSTGVLRLALQEAMQTRLEAFQAGERIYDELVKEAEARSAQILADAQAEADRIVAAARAEAERTLSDAMQQAKALHDETVRQAWETGAALAELRSQRSTLIRRLWGRLSGQSEEPAEAPAEAPAGSPAAIPHFAASTGGVAASRVDSAPPSVSSNPVAKPVAPATVETSKPVVTEPPRIVFEEELLRAGQAIQPAASPEAPRPQPQTAGRLPDGEMPPPHKTPWVIPDWLK